MLYAASTIRSRQSYASTAPTMLCCACAILHTNVHCRCCTHHAPLCRRLARYDRTMPTQHHTLPRYAVTVSRSTSLCRYTVSPNFAPPWPRIVLPHPTGTIQYHALPCCCITAPAIHCLSVTVAAKRRLAATLLYGNTPCYACATPSGTPPYRRDTCPTLPSPCDALPKRNRTRPHIAMTTLCNTCTLAALYPAAAVLHGS